MMAPGFKIKKMWAFIATEPDGTEGVCALRVGNDWMPMVAADQDRVESLKVAAQQIANHSGATIQLVEFDVRRNVERIHPRSKK